MSELRLIVCTNASCPFSSSCMTFLLNFKEASKRKLPTPKHKYMCPYYSSINAAEVLNRLDNYEEEQ